MKTRITVLGAGFGGLELSTILSEQLGDQVEITLIDKSDSFLFGFSKLDIMFGHSTLEAARMPYSRFIKPGVRFLQRTVTAIEPTTRRVITDGESFDADFLVIALGADYDFAATPGMLEFGNEFYSVPGALKVRDILPSFTGGKVIIGVTSAPFKCPPAPSECVLLLHDYLQQKGLLKQCEISLVIPFPIPIPPSPETSAALIAEFAERGITFIPNHRVASLTANHTAVLDDGTEMPYDLFLGVPRHCAPRVIEVSGMAENGWVSVDQRTLETHFPGVYAIGDIAFTKTPKAGVFAEGGARAVAESLLGRIRGTGETGFYAGAGSCYIEFGAGRIGRVDVDFLSGPKPTGKYHAPSVNLRADKDLFGSSRRARWFRM